MLKITKLFCMLFIFATPLTVLADGNRLLEQCQEVEHFLDTQQVRNEAAIAVGICLGISQGVRNTMQYLDTDSNKNRIACFPPKGISYGQAVRIILKYLRNNPEKLNEDDVLLTMLAFSAAYPCN